MTRPGGWNGVDVDGKFFPYDVENGPPRSTTWQKVTITQANQMRYLCLIWDEESKMAAMSQEESKAFMGQYMSFTDDIKKAGQYVAGEALQPVSTATTVRIRKGEVTMTDGPFAETKEQLGDFYLVEARDLNDAVKIASRIPSAAHGSIEIRPIVVFGAAE